MDVSIHSLHVIFLHPDLFAIVCSNAGKVYELPLFKVANIKQRNNLSPKCYSNPVWDSEFFFVLCWQNGEHSYFWYLFTKLGVYHLSVNRDILNFLCSLFQNLLFLQTGRKSAGKNFILLSHLELIVHNISALKIKGVF